MLQPVQPLQCLLRAHAIFIHSMLGLVSSYSIINKRWIRHRSKQREDEAKRGQKQKNPGQRINAKMKIDKNNEIRVKQTASLGAQAALHNKKLNLF